MTVKAFFAATLMVVGLLTAVLSGGCALIYFGGLMLDGGSSPYVSYEVITIIGGIPFVAGLIVFFIGKWLYNRVKKQAS